MLNFKLRNLSVVSNQVTDSSYYEGVAGKRQQDIYSFTGWLKNRRAKIPTYCPVSGEASWLTEGLSEQFDDMRNVSK